jgi:hypothetical protein
MIKRKKVCTCRDTDTQVDELNTKEVWVTTSWKYDKYAKQTVPYNKKSIGYVERKILHEIDPRWASDWRKIDYTVTEPYQIMGSLVEIAVFDYKKKDTEQNFYTDKEQLLQAINKIAVKKP